MEHYDYYNDKEKIRKAQLAELSGILDKCKDYTYDFDKPPVNEREYPYVVGYARFTDTPVELRVRKVYKEDKDSQISFDIDFPAYDEGNDDPYPCDTIGERDIPFEQFDEITDNIDEKYMK